jgi:hypothetical protein
MMSSSYNYLVSAAVVPPYWHCQQCSDLVSRSFWALAARADGLDRRGAEPLAITMSEG